MMQLEIKTILSGPVRRAECPTSAHRHSSYRTGGSCADKDWDHCIKLSEENLAFQACVLIYGLLEAGISNHSKND